MKAFWVLLLMTQQAAAQDFPFGDLISPRFDTLMIEDGEIENTALVTYHNHEDRGSDEGTFTLTSENGITVEARIEINVDDQNRERITVLTDGEYVAWPVEAVLLDGEEVKIQVMRPFS